MNRYKDEGYIKSMGIDFPLPCHVGIIMDGNGRWAKKRLLPRNAGHREGVKRLRAITQVTSRLGIDSLTVYAFSTENWKRSEEEVSGLMDLLVEFFSKFIDEVMEQHVKIVHIGETDRLSPKVLEIIKNAEEKTKNNDGLTLNLAFNYGGRREIVHAVKEIATLVKEGKLDTDSIDEKTISDHLYTKGQSDPDVIIRTSGEIRLSNFLTYQSAYSEIMVTDEYWPDFSDELYIDTLRAFAKRDRRFGNAK